MVIHVFAFAGCILSFDFNSFTYVLAYLIAPESEAANVLNSTSIYISVSMLVVTQALLCAIFW